MIRTRLPVLSAIALIVAMIFNCGVAVAGPNQTSAEYVMTGCRDAASLMTFSNVGESEEQASLMGFCAGIVAGFSFMGQPYGICVPAGTTAQQAASIIVQYIDGQPARIHEDFNRFAVEALRSYWPCSIATGARDPLPSTNFPEMCAGLPDSRRRLERPTSFLRLTWKDHLATDELKTEGEPKPYVLYSVGANDEIIERIAEGDSVEDLFKVHRRRLNLKYAVYHHGKQIFLPRWG